MEFRHGGEKSSYCGGIRVLGVCDGKLLIAEDAENCRGERGEKQEDGLWVAIFFMDARLFWLSAAGQGKESICVRPFGFAPSKIPTLRLRSGQASIAVAWRLAYAGERTPETSHPPRAKSGDVNSIV